MAEATRTGGALLLRWTAAAAIGLGSLSVCRGAPGASPTRAEAAAGADFYAAPNGTSAGNGSFEKPWDLATALGQPAAVRPGATIWLRGGTYAAGRSGFVSSLTGAPGAPVVVRSYPG